MNACPLFKENNNFFNLACDDAQRAISEYVKKMEKDKNPKLILNKVNKLLNTAATKLKKGKAREAIALTGTATESLEKAELLLLHDKNLELQKKLTECIYKQNELINNLNIAEAQNEIKSSDYDNIDTNTFMSSINLKDENVKLRVDKLNLYAQLTELTNINNDLTSRNDMLRETVEKAIKITYLIKSLINELRNCKIKNKDIANEIENLDFRINELVVSESNFKEPKIEKNKIPTKNKSKNPENKKIENKKPIFK